VLPRGAGRGAELTILLGAVCCKMRKGEKVIKNKKEKHDNPILYNSTHTVLYHTTAYYLRGHINTCSMSV